MIRFSSSSPLRKRKDFISFPKSRRDHTIGGPGKSGTWAPSDVFGTSVPSLSNNLGSKYLESFGKPGSLVIMPHPGL